MGYKKRDIELAWLSDNQCFVVACDSCGGVGTKEADVVKVAPEYAARLITRNVLLEVLSVGAKPQMLTATISNEPEPTGKALICGIRKELLEAHFESLPIAISTEKHFKIVQTSFGITVVGLATKTDLRIGCSQRGDYVYCLGVPKIGDEILRLSEQETIHCEHIEKLLQIPEVHDIIPVGSQGIFGESNGLAHVIGACIVFEPSCNINSYKPAGPCTCLLFTSARLLDEGEFNDVSISKVGRLL